MEQVDWHHVAQAVRQRRTALGLAQTATAGVSPATWTKLENARQDSYKPFLLANVERVLRWPPGTIERLARGEPPPEEPLGAIALLEARVEHLEKRMEALESRLGAATTADAPEQRETALQESPRRRDQRSAPRAVRTAT